MTHPVGLDPEVVLMRRGRTCEVSLQRDVKKLLGSLSDIWGDGNVEVTLVGLAGTRLLRFFPDQRYDCRGRLMSVVCLSLG